MSPDEIEGPGAEFRLQGCVIGCGVITYRSYRQIISRQLIKPILITPLRGEHRRFAWETFVGRASFSRILVHSLDRCWQILILSYRRHHVAAAYLCAQSHPGVELRANLKSISHRCHLFEVNLPQMPPLTDATSHRCHLFEVAFVWELTKETIHLPLVCLQGGVRTERRVAGEE